MADFLDPENRYAVEVYGRGWSPYIAWPMLERAALTVERLTRAGIIARVIDLETGRIVPLSD